MAKLTEDDYRQLMDDLQGAARAFNALTIMISDEELEAAAATVELADAVGYVVDPTAYRDRMHDGGLKKQAALIKAVRDFRGACRAIETAPR